MSVCAKDALRNTIWSCHIELVVVVSWICTLAAYWHLTNMFSSHGARHTPHRHVRTQLFRSSIRICQRWCCVRAEVATWSVRTSRIKSLHVHIPEGHISANLSHCHRSALFTGISRSLLLAGRGLFHVRVRRASEQHAHTQVRRLISRTPPQKLRDARRVSRAKFASRAFM